jgi:hypothetical protein
MNVQEMIELIPEAKQDGGAGYANESICLFSENVGQFAELGDFIVLFDNVPSIINRVLPLDDDCSFGWDNAKTTFGLIASGGRGIVKFEKGQNSQSANDNDCYYIRFYGFKSADVPYSGSSQLIKTICDTLKKSWGNTKIISDNARTSHRIVVIQKEEEEKRKQGEQWASQGLCRNCGGSLGLFKKCKKCGTKN